MMPRKEEIEDLFRLTPQEVAQITKKNLILLNSSQDFLKYAVSEIISEIQENNRDQKPTVICLPISNDALLSHLSKQLNQIQILLNRCWFVLPCEFINGENGEITRQVRSILIEKLELVRNFDSNHVLIPSKENIDYFDQEIVDLGGIDLFYGCVGDQGKIGLNIPEKGVASSQSRIIHNRDASADGQEGIYVLGMQSILKSRKLRLFIFHDETPSYARKLLRISLLAIPGDDYPVTHIRECDYQILSDDKTLG